MMPISSNCKKIAQDDPSRVGTLWKTFPEVPIVSRVVGGNPESLPGIPLELGTVKG